MKKDDFTIDSENSEDEIDPQIKKILEESITPTTPEERQRQETETQNKEKHSYSTWRKLQLSGGLKARKNKDIISLFVYAFFLLLSVFFLEIGLYKTSGISLIIAGIMLPYNIYQDKGDVAVLFRQAILNWRAKDGEKAFVEKKKYHERSIIEKFEKV